MNYLKYLWVTDLRRLTSKDKLIGFICYHYIPMLIFFTLVFLTVFHIDIWQGFLVAGFMLGWLLRGHMHVLEYAFSKEGG